MRFSIYQESHTGGRQNNQDRMGYCFTRDSLLLLMADGMGGHIMGEVAAGIALKTIGAMFQELAKDSLPDPEAFLEQGILAAHREIHRYRALKNLPETPRTTMVACVVQKGQAIWAHCGDSRLYWMRNGEILARTKDHSRFELLVAQGRVQPSERATHPERNRIFNCLGAPSQPMIDISRRAALQPGDVLLLCSDGLWSTIDDAELARTLRDNTVMRAVPELVRDAARIAGKKSDNVTALAVAWEGASAGDLLTSTTIMTDGLPVGTMTTTIPVDPDGGDPFSDTEIEKAIDDIRSAIEKSTRITNKN
ncbi:PP2C family serine/threonine-protein phosphatase [Lacisediminimonas sp.]|uniref:PP2C family protein-serine/threonine phosphatase n=1 Tax=Lacisediminimonas sp. TaxID=3060582 RepID=UPI00271AEF4F|nr:PP2C family serine/threonine-protein phosphatase [Lacisediminimonas sp.]MDO8301147.1 serine/threonine-protein phosphatase [Lacisediminimonas sp.]MDO9218526.1 serine/threonine-protein phosphatase [Lacisediminimonas sp.]